MSLIRDRGSDRVDIVDDDPAVLRATARLLEMHGYATRSHASAIDFFASDAETEPACVVLDVHMPGLGGLEVQSRLVEEGGAPPIVFVTGRPDVPRSVRAMKAGAVDFLLKPVDPHALLDAVGRATELHRSRVREDREARYASELVGSLTPREAEVMRLVTQGRRNREIAVNLGISEHTVKVHRSRMMTKLSVDSVPALMRLLLRSSSRTG